MRIFGIIGWPLGHSFSQRYFTAKFEAAGLAGECRYHNFPIERITELARVLEEYPDLEGFNVTIPYKKEIIPWLDGLSPEARAIGAVNCVRIAGGKLWGHNTDAHGFETGLERLIGGAHPGNPPSGLRALVLGTGGASCAVRWVLEKHGIGYTMVSRAGSGGALSYGELTAALVEGHKLIVNTTPLGTFPRVDEKPDIPYEAVGAGHFLYDLVYNPPVTAFLAEGGRRGAATLNGEVMLYAQAERSWEIWNERSQP